MTTAHPPESRSADSTAVSDEGQAPPLVHEMAPGQRFPSPNQVDMERGPFWRAGLLPESPWEAHPVTIIANLGEPIGESRVTTIGGVGVPYTVASAAVKKARSLGLARRSRKAQNSFEEGDQVWAVFDRDDHPRHDEAVLLCDQAGIGVARSNPCFEVWLILHEQDYNKPDGRRSVQIHFQKLRPEYDPRRAKMPNCAEIVERVEAAEKRSEAQLARRVAEGSPYGPPSTTVGKLTRAIRSAALEANLVKPAKKPKR